MPILILFFSVQVHMLHLVPQWQSAERHRKLKVMMQVSVLFFCVLPTDLIQTLK
jgi:hypothetical protein